MKKGNRKGKALIKDERFARRIDAISENAFVLNCKMCKKSKPGRFFEQGSDHMLCGDCDPLIFKCLQCDRYKEYTRFSKNSRNNEDECVCYLCEKGYVYVKKRDRYISCSPDTATKMRKCLRCDRQFKSTKNLRICKSCKQTTKHLED